MNEDWAHANCYSALLYCRESLRVVCHINAASLSSFLHSFFPSFCSPNPLHPFYSRSSCHTEFLNQCYLLSTWIQFLAPEVINKWWFHGSLGTGRETGNLQEEDMSCKALSTVAERSGEAGQCSPISTGEWTPHSGCTFRPLLSLEAWWSRCSDDGPSAMSRHRIPQTPVSLPHSVTMLVSP